METSLEIMMELDPVEGRQRETNMEVPTELDPVEGRQRETNQEIMTKQDPIESRRETEGAKPGNHNETRSNKKGDKWRQTWTSLEQVPIEGRQRETMETDLAIMFEQDLGEGRQMETDLVITLEQDPVEGRQRETNGDRPAHHVGTGTNRRETKGDTWKQTWKQCWNKLQ